MIPPPCLTCREWRELRVGETGLTEIQVDRFQTAAKLASRRLKLPDSAILTRTHRGLRAGQVVGILSTPSRTLEILPKIDTEDGAVRAALIRMLAVAWELRVADGELAALDTQRHDLLELLIGLFAGRLHAAVRRGLPRRYIAHEDDLKLLRGSLDITRQFTHLAVRPDRLACRFDELSEDTPLNRVFKAAVSRLSGLTRSAANMRRLSELAARFEYVRDASEPLREPVRLDRTNTAFHELYRLARLFLSGDWQSTAGGRADGFALLFPMNSLFEAFVGQSLKRALAPRRVRLQDRRHHALAAADGPLFALKPDFVIEAPHGSVVLDAKWKWLAPREPRREKLGVAESDIYQMLAYAQAYNAKRLILIYPWNREIDSSAGVCRRWFANGVSRRLDIATVNVGDPDGVKETLRKIVSDPSLA